jgi:hypothetical protein
MVNKWYLKYASKQRPGGKYRFRKPVNNAMSLSSGEEAAKRRNFSENPLSCKTSVLKQGTKAKDLQCKVMTNHALNLIMCAS